MSVYEDDPEPLSVQTFLGQLIAVSQPSRADRILRAVDINGPTGSTVVVMLTPTSVPDPSHVIARNQNGAANTYTPIRPITIRQSWRIVVAWSGGTRTNQETATLYAAEVYQ